MKVTEPEDSLRYTALYQATIQQAVGGAGALMTRLVAHTRSVLRAQEDQAQDRRERDRLTDSRRLLNQFEATLCARFTEELMSAFSRVASVERAAPALHFDALASMDESQLRDSVEAARAQQTVHNAADPALAELNRLICAMLGLAVVQLERNPLRPSVYVNALTAAVAHLPVPPPVRQGWTTVVSGALGQELDAYYRILGADVRARGVGSDATPSYTTAGGPLVVAEAVVSAVAPSPRTDHALLTLEKLRHLLADPPHGVADAVAQRYEAGASTLPGESGFDASEAVPTGFRPTIPAAFEAAKQMKQLDQVVQRVQQRKAAAAADPAAAPRPMREQMRAAAHGLEQALGLEVVAMMVDNITHDPRLLAPVQDIVAALEPALLQLALVDPRFFSHKQHPARRLLHEITHRSIAFESIESRGFSGFMEPLRAAVEPLSGSAIDTAEPFDQALGRLVGLWDDAAGKDKRQLAKAVKALKKAEQRNALAGTMAMDVLARKDAALVPDAVLDFLCGPWAQVVAHARMEDRTGAPDPGHFAALIDDLMWSAQPHLTRANVPALTRVVPRLLSRLRAGLATVDYPPQKTSEFFEVLMHLHQRGFKGDAGPAVVAPEPTVDANRVRGEARLGGDTGTWVAPVEEQASGFIDLATGAQALAPPANSQDVLKLGVWVALLAEGSWTRTRLTWSSPNSTLLLFTDALGYMQSLTRRSCEQLLASGDLHILSADPVEDALDAVAQVAMRNSVDVRF